MASIFTFLSRHLLRDVLADEQAHLAFRLIPVSQTEAWRQRREDWLQLQARLRLEKGGFC
ncbi:hypothetical protein CEK28_14460 [Xenophilus sp. AP218F]|nr:hypothetical protein [Chromobacterium sp. ASV5]OWY38120.1 hypothetical protein CEK28_14460 [Xenophilus sp. AP218F]